MIPPASSPHPLLETVLFFLGGFVQALKLDFNLLEAPAVLALVIAVRRGWRPRMVWAARAESEVARLSRPLWRACLLAALAAVILRVALLPVIPKPVPAVSDEFSHLLLADTLVEGRLANPPHPMWPHFESLHILQQPNYASNYFPGHAAVLALSRWATGDGWPGVLFLSGAFAAVLCWMLAAWVPPGWALAGALLAAVRFGAASYWVNSYYGGFLAAAGGALVAGAVGRLRGRFSWSSAFALAAGACVLILTRPYEGALFALPFVVMMLRWPARRWIAVALPCVLLLAGVAFGLTRYFRAVTGDPFRTAYQVSQQTYGWPLGLAWATPRPMEHRHVEMHRYWLYEVEEWRKVSSPLLFVQYLTLRAQEYWRFFFGPALTAALLLGWAGLRDPRLRPLRWGLAGAGLAVALEGAASPHYIAPATCCFAAAAAVSLRALRERPGGAELSRLLPMAILAVLGLRVLSQAAGWTYTQPVNFQSWCCKQPGNQNKHRLTEQLEAADGRHLVIVRPKHDPKNLFQWIYNEADIGRARIVWARDMGPEANRRLIEFFRGRRVWLADPNRDPVPLTPYPDLK